MRKCCGGATCACKIEAGRHAEVTGSGTAQDPLIIAADVELATEATETFTIGLFGAGTLASPWVLRVGYAPTAKLDHIPDVSATDPTNGYVLAWSSSLNRWVPAPPTTAPPGAVLGGNSVQGDGSTSAPLEVVADEGRYLTVTTSGVGLSDSGINRLIRVFANAAARATATPAPILGSISVLEDDPSALAYFDGAEWVTIGGTITVDAKPGQLLALSGSYSGGRVVQYVAQLEETTDGTGAFVVIPAEDLADYSGVLSVTVQPVGVTAGWQCTVQGSTNLISGIAWRLDNGGPYAGATIQAVVTALLY